MFRYSKKLVRKKLGHFMLESYISPLVITRGGKDEVVMVSYSQFMQLLENQSREAIAKNIEESTIDARNKGGE